MSTNKQVASTDYKTLKEQAVALGIENANTIKKNVLTQLVQQKYDEMSSDTNTEEHKAPGRPANPNSARQKRIAELAKRKAEGTLTLGRPKQTDSERQRKIAEREAKIAAYHAQQAEIAKGVKIAPEDILPNPQEKLGRPIDPTSPRQIKLREHEAKKAAGLVKKGRPSFAEQGKMTKEQIAKMQKTVTITDKADETVKANAEETVNA